MLKFEADELVNIAKRYYILLDLNNKITIAYNIKVQNMIIVSDFEKDFDLDLKDKYKISKCDIGYVINSAEGVLYFLHEYRNFIYAKHGFQKINALESMILEFRKFIIREMNLQITNQEWMTSDEENCKLYYETNKSKKKETLLNHFDKIVNPYSAGNIDETTLLNTHNLKPYLNNNRDCIQFEINDEIGTRKYLRRKEGFVYTYIGKIDNKDIHVCHYFNSEMGEGISAIIDGIKIRYNFKNKVLTIDDKMIPIEDEYFICEILMSVIKQYDFEFYKKVKIFKKISD